MGVATGTGGVGGNVSANETLQRCNPSIWPPTEANRCSIKGDVAIDLGPVDSPFDPTCYKVT